MNRDPILRTINGYTCQLWPLYLFKMNDTVGKQVGYYFDNPGTPNNLRHFDSKTKEEDSLKSGRVYLLYETLITESDAWIEAGEFNKNVKGQDVCIYLSHGLVHTPTIADLLIYAAECGITNLDMLRTFNRVLTHQGIENFEMTWPKNEPDWCVRFRHISIFIQPDGSACS